MTYSAVTRLIAAGLLLSTLATSPAAAKTYGGEGGRIGNPSKLRIPAQKREPGRIIKRPSIPEPEDRQPTRATATIPSPEPALRGGGGYERNGKYFYAKPRDIELKGFSKTNKGYNPVIPRPEQAGLVRRPKTTITSSSKSSIPSASDDYNSLYDTGNAAGSLGNFGDR